MAKLPESALARRIVRNFERDDFNIFIIHGTPRIGKSAYILKVMAQVLLYLYGYNANEWKYFKPYFGWDPDEISEMWMDIVNRIPMFTWDDAGYWLHSLNWTDPLLQAIQKYFNVIGTDMNNVILTTPSPEWILSKIAKMPGVIRIKIIKRSGGQRDVPSIMYSRLALAYKPWISPDRKKHGVNKVFKDEYICLIPDEIYKEYYPIRRRYARLAKQEIRNTLMVQRQMKSLDSLKLDGRLRRLKAEELKYAKKLDDLIEAEGGIVQPTIV